MKDIAAGFLFTPQEQEQFVDELDLRVMSACPCMLGGRQWMCPCRTSGLARPAAGQLPRAARCRVHHGGTREVKQPGPRTPKVQQRRLCWQWSGLRASGGGGEYHPQARSGDTFARHPMVCGGTGGRGELEYDMSVWWRQVARRSEAGKRLSTRVTPRRDAGRRQFCEGIV